MVNIPEFSGIDFNFTYWQQHFIEFCIQGYVNIVGYFFWPILCSSFVAYIYVKNKSAVSASVGIIIICAGFVGTGVLSHTPVVTMLFQLIVALSITGLVVVFLTKRRG